MATAKKTTAKKPTAARKPRARTSVKAVARTSFVAITDAGNRVVPVGEELAASDELVKANPDHFEPKK
jgi:hypothetical protein